MTASERPTRILCVIDAEDASTSFEASKNIELARQVLPPSGGWGHVPMDSVRSFPYSPNSSPVLVVYYIPSAAAYRKHLPDITARLTADQPSVIIVEGTTDATPSLSPKVVVLSAADTSVPEGAVLLSLLIAAGKASPSSASATTMQIARTRPNIFQISDIPVNTRDRSAYAAATQVPWLAEGPQQLLEWSIVASLPCWQRAPTDGGEGVTYFAGGASRDGYTGKQVVAGVLAMAPECGVKIIDRPTAEFRVELAEGSLETAEESKAANFINATLVKIGIMLTSVVALGSGIFSLQVSSGIASASVLAALASVPAVPVTVTNGTVALVPVVFASQCFAIRFTGFGRSICQLEDLMRRGDTEAEAIRVEDVIIGGYISEPSSPPPTPQSVSSNYLTSERPSTDLRFDVGVPLENSTIASHGGGAPAGLPTPPLRPLASSAAQANYGTTSNPLASLNDHHEYSVTSLGAPASLNATINGLPLQHTTTATSGLDWRAMLSEQQKSFELQMSQQRVEMASSVDKAVAAAVVKGSLGGASTDHEGRLATLESTVRLLSAQLAASTEAATKADHKVAALVAELAMEKLLRTQELARLGLAEREELLQIVRQLVDQQHKGTMAFVTAELSKVTPVASGPPSTSAFGEQANQEPLKRLIETECHRLFQPLADTLSANYHTKTQFQETASGIVARIPTREAVTGLVTTKVTPVEEGLKGLTTRLASELEALRAEFTAQVKLAVSDVQVHIKQSISTNNKQMSEERLREVLKDRDLVKASIEALRSDVMAKIAAEISRVANTNQLPKHNAISDEFSAKASSLDTAISEVRRTLEARTEILRSRIDEIDVKVEGITIEQRRSASRGREGSVITGVASVQPLGTVIVSTPPPPPRASTPPPQPLQFQPFDLTARHQQRQQSTSVPHYQRQLSYDANSSNIRAFATKGLVEAQYSEMRRAISALQALINSKVASQLKESEGQMQGYINGRFADYDKYHQAELKAAGKDAQLMVLHAKEGTEQSLEDLRAQCLRLQSGHQELARQVEESFFAISQLRSADQPLQSLSLARARSNSLPMLQAAPSTARRSSIGGSKSPAAHHSEAFATPPRWNTPARLEQQPSFNESEGLPSGSGNELALLSPRYEEMELLKGYFSRLAGDFKGLKQRIDAVEISQADLAPLLANEDQHLKALSTMLARIQRLEQQGGVAASTDRRTAPSTLSASRSPSNFRGLNY